MYIYIYIYTCQETFMVKNPRFCNILTCYLVLKSGSCSKLSCYKRLSSCPGLKNVAHSV